MTTNSLTFSKNLIAALEARCDTQQWEELIASLLRRLELDEKDRLDAVAAYDALAYHIAQRLSIPRHDVDIFPQGSMRTQTTISQRWPVKFDLDIVVKLSGPRYVSPDPEAMFRDFGKALEGNEDVTGDPKEKRRCWRLDYPGKRYYFDVTPAVADQTKRQGSSVSVRDPDTGWAPSNPQEFAGWFCEHASKRFPFQTRSVLLKASIEARTTVEPLPEKQVGLDDILRRSVQLMKLHRDTKYWGADDKRKEGMPISVIIVTLATHAYADLLAHRAHEFRSPIEVVLALVEAMPGYIDRDARGWRVENPRLETENFADKWNSDGGLRHRAFMSWHAQLEKDLSALLYQGAREASDDRIREVFGSVGLEAWKASRPAHDVMSGLLGSAGPLIKTNPKAPINMGSRSTLG